jgi:hypothetical protein
MKQIYLIVSSDARWVTQQRNDLIGDLLPKEMRDENLLELFSSTNQSLKFADILPQVLSELSTIPFLPDSRRVVVVHDLADLLAGGNRGKAAAKKKDRAKKEDKAPKKLSPVETFIAFAQRDLSATENVLILSTIIEFERGQYLDEKGPLYTFLRSSPLATVLRPSHRETDPLWLMGDALIERNAAQCLRHFRAIYRDDMRGRVFNEMLRLVRFTLQAKVLGKLETSGATATRIQSYLPDDKRLNFLQQPDFVREKIRRAAGRFQVRELMSAMERLLDLNRVLYPSQSMLYVPDAKFLFETFIMEFCAGRGARA